MQRDVDDGHTQLGVMARDAPRNIRFHMGITSLHAVFHRPNHGQNASEFRVGRCNRSKNARYHQSFSPKWVADREPRNWTSQDSRRVGRSAVQKSLLLHVFRRNTPQIQETHLSVGAPSSIRSSRYVHTEGAVRVLARHRETPMLRPKVLSQPPRRSAIQSQRPVFHATGTDGRHCQSSERIGLIFGRISRHDVLYFQDDLQEIAPTHK